MPNNNFIYEDSWTTEDGFVIEAGDFIKIKGKNSYGVGEWGLQFKVRAFCTNPDTGQRWVDCFEMYRGRAGVQRSFALERVKRIPKRRKRKASVK